MKNRVQNKPSGSFATGWKTKEWCLHQISLIGVYFRHFRSEVIAFLFHFVCCVSHKNPAATFGDSTSRYWRFIYLLKFLTSCILGSVWSLHCTQEDSQTKSVAEPWHKERQIISNTKQQADFVEPWITAMGGADINKAGLFAYCLRMLFVPKRCFTPSRILWVVALRAALCSLLCDPSEVTLISMKCWKGSRVASWSLYSL